MLVRITYKNSKQGRDCVFVTAANENQALDLVKRTFGAEEMMCEFSSHHGDKGEIEAQFISQGVFSELLESDYLDVLTSFLPVYPVRQKQVNPFLELILNGGDNQKGELGRRWGAALHLTQGHSLERIHEAVQAIDSSMSVALTILYLARQLGEE